ncbi:hypothetical protein WKV44_08175 [Spirochaetia bacterium 38H-sp]|uniref:Uncharacterized protein n=1 Tax=Rarispira pelagica TaxID=3141764 RepID=A0ABU9UCX0_9SPIR
MSFKRIALIMVLVLILSGMSISAFGIGIAAGLEPLGGLPGSNMLLSIKPDGSPLLWGVGFTFGENLVSLGITGDYWFANEPLIGFLNYYIGLGFYFGYTNVNDSNSVQLGGRIPIGLNVFPVSPLELFLEITPTLTQVISDPFVFPNFSFGLQGAIGLRLWSR